MSSVVFTVNLLLLLSGDEDVAVAVVWGGVAEEWGLRQVSDEGAAAAAQRRTRFIPRGSLAAALEEEERDDERPEDDPTAAAGRRASGRGARQSA